MEIISNSEKETMDIAEKIAQTLRGGEILALIGGLGAGKTVFSKGLAKALGINQNLSSPTFVYMKLYEIRNPKEGQKNIDKLCHIDAYRAHNEYDIINIGAEDYIGKENIITAIEWADRIKNILPERTRYIEFINQGGGKRVIKINN